MYVRRCRQGPHPTIPVEAPMSTSKTFKRLAAGTAAAAALAASAGAAGLCLAAPADAAVLPGTSVVRTLADDEFQTAAAGLRVPAAHPAARTAPAGKNEG